MPGHETNPWRAAAGLLLGAITGGGLVSLGIAVSGVVHDFLDPGLRLGHVLVPFAVIPIVWIYASMVWGLGLYALAPIPWAVLDHFGFRSHRPAIILGSGLTCAVCVALRVMIWLHGSPSNAPSAHSPSLIDLAIEIAYIAAISLIGGMVGLVVWRTAYRKV